MSQRIRAGLFIIGCLFVAGFGPQSDEQKVIGVWEDKLGNYWRQEITIVMKGSQFYRISRFQDGSQNQSRLVELAAKAGEKRRFKDRESSRGEVYVVNAKGNLDLYDEEGFIREAKKRQ